MSQTCTEVNKVGSKSRKNDKNPSDAYIMACETGGKAGFEADTKGQKYDNT